MTRILLVVTVLLLACGASDVLAQTAGGADLAGLEARVDDLENRPINSQSAAGGAAFLFGAFCALWAQNTGRNAWLWFFMGLLFNVISVIVLLVKNSNDRKRAATA